MELLPLTIPGAYELRADPHVDFRGFFARIIDLTVLKAHGLYDHFEQGSLSFNKQRGTLRGLHFQASPHWETKIVTCVAGRIFDVVVDLRRESPAFGRWEARELDASSCNSLYVPIGCAHGFQTLDPNTAVLYSITPAYRAELARGVHPFDTELSVSWPIEDAVLSERDLALPTLRDLAV